MVSWKTIQQTVALSASEAKYMALATAVQEALNLRSLVRDLRQDFKNVPVKILEDDQGTMSLTTNRTNCQRRKQVDYKYHFVRDNVSCGNVIPVYCPTENMKEDVFTKSTTKVKMESFSKYLFGM